MLLQISSRMSQGETLCQACFSLFQKSHCAWQKRHEVTSSENLSNFRGLGAFGSVYFQESEFTWKETCFDFNARPHAFFFWSLERSQSIKCLSYLRNWPVILQPEPFGSFPCHSRVCTAFTLERYWCGMIAAGLWLSLPVTFWFGVFFYQSISGRWSNLQASLSWQTSSQKGYIFKCLYWTVFINSTLHSTVNSVLLLKRRQHTVGVRGLEGPVLQINL